MNLPVLDLKIYEKDKSAFLKNLREITSNVGFFYLINHGIDKNLNENLFKLSKDFFNLPRSSKELISMVHSPQFRGYTSEGFEYTAGEKDYREQIDIGTERKALKWDLNSPLWQRLEGPNLWPDEIPELKEIFLAWHEQTRNACLKILQAFAEALDLPSDAFGKLYGENSYEHCKIIHYPKISKDASQGVGPHKDGGLITFVFQEEQNGLEAFIDDQWISVPLLEGSVVVNIGEFLELATNGYLKATIHRVNLSPKERFSIAYFLGVQLDKDIPIFPLNPELVQESKGVDTDPKNPLLRNVASNYFKRMIRSHPDVARIYHSDLIEKFSFA
ncbi:isopenicillin N synthase family dioxygenase [Campylobacter coli]|uniref:isopenicillin N synthase family dioxygenase n=1 Tax=Campylobacter coli TaxID=195 RepID=UPI00141C6B1B|nr:isopenicillin N synthase family oxygenase [Campylobacter coli]EDO6811775.1 isopenicillin N synthase family oxygenase [Campylobacter coli]EDO7137713.1 isopenicillin N synthase family oxygenase [Campylobacter coli]EKD6388923.1 isopenicillin N synthase family oxygenase [Campylobacter coli]HEA7924199.1 isopenicillin N synthase family oxygenase [Campylobacter coli]